VVSVGHIVPLKDPLNGVPRRKLLFFGSNNPSNLYGILDFLENVLPALRTVFPGIELVFAGNGWDKIPAGREGAANQFRSVDTLRLGTLADQVAPSLGGGPGDLYVVVHLKQHPVFERDGDSIYRQLKVSMVQAALGRTVLVDSLIDGPVEMAIPEGAQTGEVVRIPGLGMPRLRDDRRGDMLVQLVVATPKKLDRRQRELLEEFAALGDSVAAPEPEPEAGAEEEAATRKKKKRRWGL
jgi:hypothetical protein